MARLLAAEPRIGKTMLAIQVLARKLHVAARALFAGGAMLYDGNSISSFSDGLCAFPVRALWEEE
ncbi:MAG: hypothetical protein ONB23_13460 [candidate division KSB1 bacterium]|nr:hypothetical protein [candidate division KSB1 bacterium]